MIKLKEALGLSDEDAAPAHIDVARRLYRQGFETKDRQQQFEQRKVRGRSTVFRHRCNENAIRSS